MSRQKPQVTHNGVSNMSLRGAFLSDEAISSFKQEIATPPKTGGSQ